MSRADFPFSFRFRIRYAEVDPQSIVFNSRYLEYADLLLTEYWRALGLPTDFEVNVVRALVDYKKPIRADEEIDGYIRVDRMGSSSMTTLFELHGAGADDLRAAIEMVHVHVDLAAGKSIPIPQPMRALFGF